MSRIPVDKVGTFFRDTQYEGDVYGDDTERVIRVVFDLVLEEGARKCITVRSALSIRNNTSQSLEVLLVNPVSHAAPSFRLPLLRPGEVDHLPVDKVDWCIKLRAHGGGYQYSDTLKWHTTTRASQVVSSLKADASGERMYLVAVAVRGRYPTMKNYLPGHEITVETPVVLTNSLPVDIRYRHGDQGRKMK
eukprot:sb/3471089/